MMKGTPSHRGLLIQRTIAAKVGLTESLGTVSSSLYPGLSPPAVYWPRTTSSRLMGGMHRRTLT